MTDTNEKKPMLRIQAVAGRTPEGSIFAGLLTDSAGNYLARVHGQTSFEITEIKRKPPPRKIETRARIGRLLHFWMTEYIYPKKFKGDRRLLVAQKLDCATLKSAIRNMRRDCARAIEEIDELRKIHKIEKGAAGFHSCYANERIIVFVELPKITDGPDNTTTWEGHALICKWGQSEPDFGHITVTGFRGESAADILAKLTQ